MIPARFAPALALALAALVGLSAAGQEATLGEAGRREKARREKTGGHAPGGRIYTNDDLEALRQGKATRGNLNIMEGQPLSEAPAGEGSRKESGGEGERPAGAPEQKETGEAGWRARADEIRSAMDAAQRTLESQRTAVERLRQQLNPQAGSYVQDPNERLRLQSDLTAAERAVEQAQRDLEQARARYQELLKDAQEQRIPAGWISNAS